MNDSIRDYMRWWSLAMIMAFLALHSPVRAETIPTDTVQTEPQSRDLAVLNTQIDINSATEQEWVSLKGIGPKRAKAILEYKKQIGGFKSVDDLLGVRGIGQKALSKMRPMLKV